MALTPKGSVRITKVNGVFNNCLVAYDATHGDRSTVLAIGLSASDMSNNPNPTNDQILAVANPKAIEVYNKWVANISAAQTILEVNGLPNTPIA